MSRSIGRIMGTLHTLLSSRTWRLRGAAAAVLVVLAGGWTLGVAGLGGETAADRAVATTPTETSTDASSDAPSGTASDMPTPEELDPSEVAGAATTATEAAAGGVEPVAESPAEEPDGSAPPPRTRNPEPSPTRGTPTPTPKPSQTPKPTPSETADCADLAEAVDCLLAPITSKP